MTKVEIFNKIAEICAAVCNVSVEDIMSGSRTEDVVTARSLMVFWCDAAGFSVDSILVYSEKSNHNSIDNVKGHIEEYWRDRFAYHMLAKEIGKRLLEYAHEIGEDFDMWRPINRMKKLTGR